jgi:signal transduction histidine kinase
MALPQAEGPPGRVAGLHRWTSPVDLGIGLVLAGAGVVSVSRIAEESHPWAELGAAVALVSLAFRTRAPVVMVALCCAGLAGYSLLPYPGTPLPFFVGILAVSFFAGAGIAGRQAVVAVLALMAAVLLVQLQTEATASADEQSWADVYLTPLVIVGGPALAGGLLRRSRRQTAELRRVTAELAAERLAHAEAAAAGERARIARELHDVISHSVSVMVVQAGAAEQALPAGSAAREQVHAIRTTGKEALAELRRQLGVLRADDQVGPAPLPGVDDIEALAAAGGATVLFEGSPRPDLPAGTALTAYRVVQESLTNARRHAFGGSVTVRVTFHNGGVDLVTEDTGGIQTSTGSGFGLRGIRERVEMYGGRVDVGPRTDGPGWCVHAWIPTIPAGAGP